MRPDPPIGQAPSEQDRAIREEIHLAPYDSHWPVLFERERVRLMSRFPQLLAVEHMGSTAVPGMRAKPIIDLLAGVSSMTEADALFEPVLAFGYTTSRAFNAMLPDRRWFMRSSAGHRTHHLHVVVHLGKVWQEHLRFRDLLRGNAGLAAAYANLKSELAARFTQDRDAYTAAKSAFIAAALQSS